MTLQEAKDKVAKKHGYPSWKRLCHNGVFDGAPEKYTDEAAELYAKSKWHEACDAQRKLCFNSWWNYSCKNVHDEDGFRDSIIQAANPEYKP